MSRFVAVVDDDRDMRFSLEALIHSIGEDVALFETADQLLRSPSLADAACVVSDVHMPGTNGIQLARRLQSPDGPPVILMTAHSTPSLERSAYAAGARRFFNKPFAPDDLIEELEEILG